MSFDRNHLSPSLETHVPVQVHVPSERNDVLVGRPDLPTPSLWQNSVLVTHRETKRRAVVHRVDWATNMFRPYYPDEGEVDPETKKPKGRFAERTEWEHCRDWLVEVTFSPAELARQAARDRLEAEMALLDAKELAAVAVLCDDPDASKALAKLEALRALGIVKVSAAAAAEAVAEVQAPKRGPRKAAPPTNEGG
jgi:hypothetical protein